MLYASGYHRGQVPPPSADGDSLSKAGSLTSVFGSVVRSDSSLVPGQQRTPNAANYSYQSNNFYSLIKGYVGECS